MSLRNSRPSKYCQPRASINVNTVTMQLPLCQILVASIPDATESNEQFGGPKNSQCSRGDASTPAWRFDTGDYRAVVSEQVCPAPASNTSAEPFLCTPSAA